MDRVKELSERGELDESYRLLTEYIDGCTAGERVKDAAELSDAYNTRGHICYLWVDFDGAVKDYTSAIKLNPDFAVAHYNRGQVHYRLGRYQLAERDLQIALDLDPQFTDAHLNLQQVRADLDRGHSFNTGDKFCEDC